MAARALALRSRVHAGERGDRPDVGGSAGATILAFKLLAGVAIAAATGFVAIAAARIRPERAPLAAALVGLNPVLVVHTVGGGHVDALIAARSRPRWRSP